jgi:hypothetical protein
MPESKPINRRQWLKAAGGAVAGAAVLASRASGRKGPTEPGAASRPADPAPPAETARPAREIIHGFEDYPPV